MYSHNSQASPVANTALKASAAKKYGVGSIGLEGSASATMHNARAPNNICQAVSASRSNSRASRMRLATTAEAAHVSPPPTASRLLKALPPAAQGSSISTRPRPAIAIAPHCSPRTRSPNAHHAIGITQNGMV